MKRIGSRGAPLGLAVALTILVGPGPASAADAPVGKWKTVDEKSGRVTSEVELYQQGGKIIGLPEPKDAQGKPKDMCQVPGRRQGQAHRRARHRQGSRAQRGSLQGTILDPEDGEIYKAEIWTEDGKLKVRGYLGPFYRTQTWLKGS